MSVGANAQKSNSALVFWRLCAIVPIRNSAFLFLRLSAYAPLCFHFLGVVACFFVT